MGGKWARGIEVPAIDLPVPGLTRASGADRTAKSCPPRSSGEMEGQDQMWWARLMRSR